MTEREAAEHMAFTIERAVAKWIDGKLDAHDHHDLQMAVAQYRVVRSVLDTLAQKEAEVWPELVRSPLKPVGEWCTICRGSGFYVPAGRPDMDGGPCERCGGTGRVP